MTKRYQFTPCDAELLRAATLLLRKVMGSDKIRPGQMVTLAKLQHILSVLPRATEDVTASVSVCTPTRTFGEIETFHWSVFSIEEERLKISCGGHFYRPSTGGDTFTTMIWEAFPGLPTALEDYSELHRIVPDLRTFPEGVESIDFSTSSYSLEIYDDDNPLLEADEDDEESSSREQSDPALQPEKAMDGEEKLAAVQQMLFSLADEPNSPIELYRRDGMIEAFQKEWHMALLIFQEMGWQPARALEKYAYPLTFITQDEGHAMQQSGQSFFTLIREDPMVGLSVPMDIQTLYQLTEFVGGGAFIVGQSGSHELARANDF
jgi:hypothetical protein